MLSYETLRHFIDVEEWIRNIRREVWRWSEFVWLCEASVVHLGSLLSIITWGGSWLWTSSSNKLASTSHPILEENCLILKSLRFRPCATDTPQESRELLNLCAKWQLPSRTSRSWSCICIQGTKSGLRPGCRCRPWKNCHSSCIADRETYLTTATEPATS